MNNLSEKSFKEEEKLSQKSNQLETSNKNNNLSNAAQKD